MLSTMEQLGIDRLSPADRVSLALAIWESLGDLRPGVLLGDSDSTELQRRDSELEANPAIARTWEQIRGSVERRP